jgi:hypothetical protein
MSKMLYDQLNVMRRRNVPETDSRIVAIKRILDRQESDKAMRDKPFSHLKPVRRRVK